jgi:hypothetical protein
MQKNGGICWCNRLPNLGNKYNHRVTAAMLHTKKNTKKETKKINTSRKTPICGRCPSTRSVTAYTEMNNLQLAMAVHRTHVSWIPLSQQLAKRVRGTWEGYRTGPGKISRRGAPLNRDHRRQGAHTRRSNIHLKCWVNMVVRLIDIIIHCCPHKTSNPVHSGWPCRLSLIRPYGFVDA